MRGPASASLRKSSLQIFPVTPPPPGVMMFFQILLLPREGLWRTSDRALIMLRGRVKVFPPTLLFGNSEILQVGSGLYRTLLSSSDHRLAKGY